jgi:hypothetical protein
MSADVVLTNASRRIVSNAPALRVLLFVFGGSFCAVQFKRLEATLQLRPSMSSLRVYCNRTR